MWDVVSISSVVLAFLAVVLTYLNYKILLITKEMLDVTIEIKLRTDDLYRTSTKTYKVLAGDIDPTNYCS